MISTAHMAADFDWRMFGKTRFHQKAFDAMRWKSEGTSVPSASASACGSGARVVIGQRGSASRWKGRTVDPDLGLVVGQRRDQLTFDAFCETHEQSWFATAQVWRL